MKIIAPQYYYDFQCIASRCSDSCCKEWAVDVDPDAAAFYRALPGALGDRLRSVLEDDGGSTVMRITDGRCPMWRQDGLCEIQATLGHDALCQTCRDFPRLRHDYGDFLQLELELSCPEAARLIFTGDSTPVYTQEDGGDVPDYDLQTMQILQDAREEVLSFLNSTSMPLNECLAIILLHAHALQTQIDTGTPAPFDPSACLDDARRFAGDGALELLTDFFEHLEILTGDWRALLSMKKQAPVYYRPLIRYFLQRYWLQAVSDWDLVGRVKLMVTACILIGSLPEDPIRAAQLFSKEIENDPDNIEAILDGCYRSPALTDGNLLGLLLRH